MYDKKLGYKIIPEYIHPAKVFQRCIQSLARDIIGDQLIEVSKKYKVVMTVHDELVMLCPEKEVEQCVSFVKAVYDYCLPSGVPIYPSTVK